MGFFSTIFKRGKEKAHVREDKRRTQHAEKLEQKKREKKTNPDARDFDPSAVPAASGGARKPKKEHAGDAYRVLVHPHLTEKATNLGQMSQYVFEVMPDANRLTVKRAVAELYGVDVLHVNIIRRSGKDIRYGRTSGRTRQRKMAIVTLQAGEKIEVYEGV